MPLKKVKRDTQESLTLGWILHVRNYDLALDRTSCVGCQICTLGCPKEAITLEKQEEESPEDKATHARVDIDLEKCNFCGICDLLCPFGAIQVTVDGEHFLSVVDKESFPELIRDIRVDATKCPEDCVECEEACPLELIRVKKLTTEGVEENTEARVQIDVDTQHCPCCRVCEFKCPEGAITVRKIFQGSIAIHPEKCPDGCTDCLDVCPITGALYLSEADKKVSVNEVFCVYCGACKIVCPVDDALDLKRSKIMHTPIHSGAWNKALEKLTSPIEVTKELKAKSSSKLKESVEKRLKWKAS